VLHPASGGFEATKFNFMQIAILGAGMVGRAMAIDLTRKYNVNFF